MDDRLYRSVDDRMLAGVAGGVAERLDADPSIIRIVWALLIFLTGGLALVAYVVMAVVVPEDPGPDPAGGPRRSPDPAPWPAAAPNPTPADEGAGATVAMSDAAMATAAVADTPTVATGSTWLAPDTTAATPGPGEPTAPQPAAVAPGSSGAWVGPDGRTVSRAEARRDARRARRADREDRGPLIAGLILIVLGALFLLGRFIPSIDLGSWWPIILVGIGVVLVVVSVSPRRRPD